MHIEKLKSIQECLASAAEAQIYDLENVDAQELGEVIDIIKDIEETIYYCTVTKAMEESEKYKGEEMMYYTPMYRETRERNGGQGYDMSRMYYGGTAGGSNGSSSSGRYSSSSSNGSNSSRSNSQYSEREFPGAFQDMREGRSPRSRRMYMEAKETKQDKATQMKELEHYMQELAQDVTEMIEGSSPEERQYLSKKISALATKLNQSNG